jgi:hypothetical protein
MIINGIDLSTVEDSIKEVVFPETVKGRVLHLDSDFLAYSTSYEKPNEEKSFKEMQHNAGMAIEKYRRHAGAESVHLHLTPGTSNKGHRGALAIQKEYQGNRKNDKAKPRYLHLMRDWMAKHYAATLHQDCEADDGMSSAQYAALDADMRERSVICSGDKDLLMVPGLHMDYGDYTLADTETDFGSTWLDATKSSKKIKGLGQKFFWSQMLTGDTVDNIQGIPKVKFEGKWKPVGPVMADVIMQAVTSNKLGFDMVKTLYERYGNEFGFTHWQTGESVPWQRVFVSEAQLLWMRREKHNPNCVLKWFKEINA